jgi:hypothetical protein
MGQGRKQQSDCEWKMSVIWIVSFVGCTTTSARTSHSPHDGIVAYGNKISMVWD